MRTELTFMALACEPNRFRLAQVIAKATRELHRPNTRVPDTMNGALELFTASSSRPATVIMERALDELRRVA